MRDDIPPGGLPPYVLDNSGDMSDTHNSIFHAAVLTTRMPIVLTDPNQRDNPIVFANPAFIQMIGYDEDEIIGQNCRFLQGPQTDADTVDRVRIAIDEKKPIAVELLNYKKNGSSFWNALFISPVYDSKGNLINYFASQLDVTRRREAEDAYSQSQKMEAVGNLTGGVAHDFNNLLTVVSGFAELLETNLAAPTFNHARAKKAVDAILVATARGAELTAQLLAFARKQKLQGRVVSMPDLVDQFAPLIERTLGDGIKLTIEHKEPKSNTFIDSVQAESALINIATNARHAMCDVGEFYITTGMCNIEVNDPQFHVEEPGCYVYVSLRDTGPGMDPDTIQHITEPFFTTKTEGKGTGLGMAMVEGFIRQSEGFLKIESEIGKGTTIHLLFKCHEGEVDKPPVYAKRTHLDNMGNGERILVVDDRADVADYVQSVLDDLNYQTLRASNANEALEILNGVEGIDLLFTDVIMPGINGVQLAREALKIQPDIKILLTTGYTDSSIAMIDSNGAPFDFISKPCRKVELTKRIRQSLDGPNGVS